MGQDRVFDTSALTAFLEGEPEADDVAELIERTAKADGSRLICVINLGEVWYNVARKRLDADRIVNELLGLNFTVVDADWELTRTAAELKVKYKLGFADSYAAALAKMRTCELVAKDQEFKKLSREIKLRLLKAK